MPLLLFLYTEQVLRSVRAPTHAFANALVFFLFALDCINRVIEHINVVPTFGHFHIKAIFRTYTIAYNCLMGRYIIDEYISTVCIRSNTYFWLVYIERCK